MLFIVTEKYWTGQVERHWVELNKAKPALHCVQLFWLEHWLQFDRQLTHDIDVVFLKYDTGQVELQFVITLFTVVEYKLELHLKQKELLQDVQPLI
jgi:hypothetical protein